MLDRLAMAGDEQCLFGFKIGMYKNLSSDQKQILRNKRHQRNTPNHDFYESHGNRWVIIPERGE
jgi:hypothetical protein